MCVKAEHGTQKKARVLNELRLFPFHIASEQGISSEKKFEYALTTRHPAKGNFGQMSGHKFFRIFSKAPITKPFL